MRLYMGLVVSSFWFIRNWALTGPPTFPVRLSGFGVDYILYFRRPDAPVPATYADAERYPLVFVDKKKAAWVTIHRVQR